MKRRQNNEAQLEKELGRFFRKLKKSVLKELNEYWSDYQLLQGQVNLMLSPIHEAHKEYYEIIRKYKLREYQLGKAEAKRLIKRANKDKVALKAVTTLGIQGFVDKDKNNLFGTIPKAEQDLLNRTFRTSQNTLNRVDSQLNQIISDGYREGKGINKVANDITQRFDQLADWEARRIARTEINTSHNQATRDQYREDGVEYTQWIAANDDRTRDSHAEVDGEIIPIDGKYSNGLSFPGDTSGPLEEWINCRCSNAPFVIPYGFMAPSFSPFRESDLVPINTESLGEPSQEQLEQNLTQEQRSQYEQYTKAVNEAQSILDSKFSLPRERLQARTQLEYNLSKLNQLKLVANGELARGYQQLVKAVTTPSQEQKTENQSTIIESVDFFETLNETQLDLVLERVSESRLADYSTALEELEMLLLEYKNAAESRKDIIEQRIQESRDYMKKLELDSRKKKVDVFNIPVESYKRAPQNSNIKTISALEQKQIDAQRKTKFNEKDIDGIDYYLGPNYMDMASYIYGTPYIKEVLERIPTKKGREAYINDIKEKYKQIEKIMEKTPRCIEDMIFFRGGKFDENMEVGETGKWECPTSTSYQESVAKDFVEEGEYFIEIYAPKGTKGVAVNDGRFHKHSSSHEYILAPNQEFILLGINRKSRTCKILLI